MTVEYDGECCKICETSDEDLNFYECEVCGFIVCENCVDWRNSWMGTPGLIVCKECGKEFIPY